MPPESPENTGLPDKSRGLWKPAVLILAIVAMLVAARIFGLGELLGRLRGWIQTQGALGPFIFVFIYAAATVAALPGSALTVAAGAIFGSAVGVVSVIFGATLGAALAFLVSRYFARDAVARWLSTKDKFRKLDQLTETHGAVIVALTRLVPIFPFNLLNYGFGLTKVRFWTYVLWSFVCMLPGTILYVVGADAVTKGLSQGKVPWGLVGVFAAAIVLLTVVVRQARKKTGRKGSGNRAHPEERGGSIMSAVTILPRDAHNDELIANVHPPDWVNPEPSGRYNLVVIGAGTAGLVTAAGAAGLGARVALIERHLMGGDCLNVGCVPSKAVISASRAAGDVAAAARFGVAADLRHVDFGFVMERMRRIRSGISRHDSAKRFSELGVDVFLGDAEFTGADTVAVGDKTLQFKRAVITTGARAAVPPVEGLADAGYYTNETIFELTERPNHLVVVGAGPIGCELAQAFKRLASRVMIVEQGAQFLPREDPDAASLLAESFSRDGIEMLLNAKLSRVRVENGEKKLDVDVGGETRTLSADAILIGVGRRPNVDGLNLEKVGVEYDPRLGVKVDDGLRTTNPRIFAAGDICMTHKFTHAADAAARIVIQNALFYGRKKLSALTMPWCTYTDPEIAHVGLYERDARERGMAIDTFKQELSGVDRAIADGEEDGFVKIHVRKGTDQIVGATIVAKHAGDMISEVTLAMVGGVGLGTLSGVIHPYPTQAEAIKKIADSYNRTRLTPRVKSLMTKFLAWTR
ncbi:MAG: FAD-containing oxidoreductase [Deltaproteobacteria bacterium]|nr:FAD-containing oxidoreductase [Deltaproteobacteria bacterium]